MSFYNYTARSISGFEVSMSSYSGKVILVVNTASKCGLTPQYEGLEKLYQKYKDQGLVILGFPSNQFGNQEPGNNAEISEFCQVNYGVRFPIFEKIEVNGDGSHPIYQYLKKQKSGFLGSRIKWNFTKFLIDKEGRVVRRFAPSKKPSSLEPYIQKLL